MMEFQLSYLKSWKMMLWKVLHSICQKIWKTHQWPQDRKRSVFIAIPKAVPKSAQTTAQLHSSHMLVKWCLKFSKPGFSSTWTWYAQAGFRKGRGTRDQIANIHWIIEKAREFLKNIYFCFIDYTKAFDCVDHKKLCKILTRPPDLLLEKSVCS